MAYGLTMPKLSPTMEEGTVAKWHVQAGDTFEAGDLLLEVSTDKATVEHNALDEGVIAKILVQEGEVAQVNQPIALLEGEELLPEEKKEQALVQAETKNQRIKEVPKAVDKGRIKASPLARKLAQQKSIDLTTLQGTGPGGRIVKKDLGQSGSQHLQPLSPIRKVIAQRLQAAKRDIPHYYLVQSVDVDSLVAEREQLKAAGYKVTYNDFVLRAVALSLKEHAAVNSGFDAEREAILSFDAIDISVAVTIPEGLITPIIFDVDQKDVFQISEESKRLSAKAREGKLQPAEFQGGSFTVSNLGMYGLSSFAAVINPPQAAILAVGGIDEVPVVKEGAIVPGKRMQITLSADHRVIDGALGAQFLQTVRGYLENPALLLV